MASSLQADWGSVQGAWGGGAPQPPRTRKSASGGGVGGGGPASASSPTRAPAVCDELVQCQAWVPALLLSLMAATIARLENLRRDMRDHAEAKRLLRLVKRLRKTAHDFKDIL